MITTKLARQFRISASTLLLLLAAGAAAAPDVGDTPPDYIGKTVDGVPVQLSQHPGKVLVVSFWATWCPYCLKELPILNGIQKLAGKEQMHVVAVNTEERAVFRKVVRALSKLAKSSLCTGVTARVASNKSQMTSIGRSRRLNRWPRAQRSR